jgi:GT2 family glycosyltransferase
MLAPIILFVYKRPNHLKKTLESLAKNDLASQSSLFIYSDGPKKNTFTKELKQIREVRKISREKQWCSEVNIIEREKNMGLASSIIAGVSEIIKKFGKVIVLEDDLLISKNFLRYMNDALDKFENEKKVMQISGFVFPVDLSVKCDAFFLPLTTSWGWATWKRVWDDFDKTGRGLKILAKDKKMRKRFDLNNSYPYYKMLKSQVRGKVDSWAIRFYLSVFLKGGLVLYPRETLVNHIGGDGSGTHCKKEIEQNRIDDLFLVKRFPEKIFVEKKEEELIVSFLKKQRNLLKNAFKFIKERIK